MIKKEEQEENGKSLSLSFFFLFFFKSITLQWLIINTFMRINKVHYIDKKKKEKKCCSLLFFQLKPPTSELKSEGSERTAKLKTRGVLVLELFELLPPLALTFSER